MHHELGHLLFGIPRYDHVQSLFNVPHDWFPERQCQVSVILVNLSVPKQNHNFDLNKVKSIAIVFPKRR